MTVRDEHVAPTLVDLDQLVTRIEPTLRALADERTGLVITLGPTVGRVSGRPAELEQALVALVLDAREAMSDGGQITIGISNVDLGDGPAQPGGRFKRGRCVVLAVAHIGRPAAAGVSIVGREPCDRTPHGSARHRGLATAYEIVTRNGGSMRLTSGVRRSATVEVFLPRVEEDPSEEGDVLGHGPTATILVVDDEPQVRELIRDVLRGQGYRVLEAASGMDALDLAQRHKGSIDLVIADVVMPGTAGEALVTRLAASCPGIKAVYMSGYARDVASQRGLGGGGKPFLEKPFSLEALTETVRDVLGR